MVFDFFPDYFVDPLFHNLSNFFFFGSIVFGVFFMSEIWRMFIRFVDVKITEIGSEMMDLQV